jgi:hypothetical protein
LDLNLGLETYLSQGELGCLHFNGILENRGCHIRGFVGARNSKGIWLHQTLINFFEIYLAQINLRFIIVRAGPLSNVIKKK